MSSKRPAYPGFVRMMTNHERYALMRQNTGRPHGIVWVATYAAGEAPSVEALERRVAELQHRLEALRARVINANTNKPAFMLGEPWDPTEIVGEATYTPSAVHEQEAMAIFKVELTRFESVSTPRGVGGVATPPPWAVRLYRGPPGAPYVYLTAAFNHTHTDGRGSQRLFLAIAEGGETLASIALEPFEKPSRYDDTVPMKPTPLFLTPIAWRELVVTKLPRWVQTRISREDPWPGSQVSRSPLVCGWGVAFCDLPAPTVDRIKAVGLARGIKTLHPIIKMAYLAAMWAVFHDSLPHEEGTTRDRRNGGTAMRLESSTSRDERRPGLGHSAFTGNYVSSIHHKCVVAGSDTFWSLCRPLANYLASSSGIANGRMTVGLLSHIPDPDVDPASPDFDPTAPTGWEQYFIERASSPAPFRDSLTISNLGKCRIPLGALDLVWGQTASPFLPPLSVNVLGHSGGLRLNTVFREGAAVSAHQVEEIHALWLRVMRSIADGKGEKRVSELTQLPSLTLV